jgi:hypothetical protein
MTVASRKLIARNNNATVRLYGETNGQCYNRCFPIGPVDFVCMGLAKSVKSMQVWALDRATRRAGARKESDLFGADVRLVKGWADPPWRVNRKR